MPFDPKDFLRLSKDLVNDPSYSTRESVFRTSISRAYYSAFLICRTWLETQKVTFPKTGKAHKIVVNELRKTKVFMKLLRKTRAVADVLVKLRWDGRNEADYNLKKTFTSRETLNWIRDAEYVINSIP